MRSTRFFCRRRAMNSSSARVTAALLVRSPLTSSASSINSGSNARLVAMCHLLHMSLHKISAWVCRFAQERKIPKNQQVIDVKWIPLGVRLVQCGAIYSGGILSLCNQVILAAGQVLSTFSGECYFQRSNPLRGAHG